MIEQAAGGQASLPFRSRIDRPIFIVSTPRSGSTLLFETLAQAPGLFTTGMESHGLIERIPGLSPGDHGWQSNRLTAAEATAERVDALARAFFAKLSDRDRQSAGERVRMLEKTPKNALRVPFFDAAWPDATFVYLYRDARQAIASMIEAWLFGRFRTYPRLPGWKGQPWSLLLIPGWQRLVGQPLERIVAQQWATTTEVLIDDLSRLPEGRVRGIVFDEFVDAPQAVMRSLAESLGLPWDRCLGPQLPLSKTTVSRPGKEKWRVIEPVIDAVWPLVEKADAKARAFVESLRQADRPGGAVDSKT